MAVSFAGVAAMSRPYELLRPLRRTNLSPTPKASEKKPSIPARGTRLAVFGSACAWNLVLHSLTVGFPNGTKEQDPSFTMTAFFFF